MGTTLTVSMVIVLWGGALLTWESLGGKVFCYLKYQSLVSVATSMGFKQLRGRVWRVARSWGALGKGAACSHGESWRTECWVTLGRVGEGRVVFMAVGKNRDIQKLSCSSPVSQT